MGKYGCQKVFTNTPLIFHCPIIYRVASNINTVTSDTRQRRLLTDHGDSITSARLHLPWSHLTI